MWWGYFVGGGKGLGAGGWGLGAGGLGLGVRVGGVGENNNWSHEIDLTLICYNIKHLSFRITERIEEKTGGE